MLRFKNLCCLKVWEGADGSFVKVVFILKKEKAGKGPRTVLRPVLSREGCLKHLCLLQCFLLHFYSACAHPPVLPGMSVFFSSRSAGGPNVGGSEAVPLCLRDQPLRGAPRGLRSLSQRPG